MTLDERDRLDIHDETDDNPVVSIETNGEETRLVYKDGTIDWKQHDRTLTEDEEGRCEEIYQMGRRSNG